MGRSSNASALKREKRKKKATRREPGRKGYIDE